MMAGGGFPDRLLGEHPEGTEVLDLFEGPP